MEKAGKKKRERFDKDLKVFGISTAFALGGMMAGIATDRNVNPDDAGKHVLPYILGGAIGGAIMGTALGRKYIA